MDYATEITADELQLRSVMMFANTRARDDYRRPKQSYEFTERVYASLYKAELDQNLTRINPVFDQIFRSISSEVEAYQVAINYGTHFLKATTFGTSKAATFNFRMPMSKYEMKNI